MKIIREILLFIFLKFIGGNTMAIVYATLILKGLKTIDDVPAIIRQQVIDYLSAMEIPGYTEGSDVVEQAQ